MNVFTFLSILAMSCAAYLISCEVKKWKQKKLWFALFNQKLPKVTKKVSSESALSSMTDKIELVINRYPQGKRVTLWLADAGQSVGLTVGNLIIITLGLQVLAVNIAGLLKMSIPGCMVLALVVEVGIIWTILKKGANAEQMEKEFPKVLETIAKVYRLHPDLKESAIRVTERVEDPRLKRVFNQVVQLSTGGLTTIEALEYSSQQLVYPPLQFMVSMLKSRLHLGGNISLFLEEMAHSLKLRRETERQIASTIFQNKISALIVSALVPILFVFSFLFSQQYRTIVLQDSFARFVIVAALVWWVVGVLFISRVVRVRI